MLVGAVTGRDEFAIRRASQAANLVVHALELPQLLPRLHVPQTQRAIPSPRDQLPALGDERYTPDGFGMPCKPLYLPAGRCVPHPCRVIVRTGGNPAPVGGEGDRAITTRIVPEGANGLAGLNIPQTHGVA